MEIKIYSNCMYCSLTHNAGRYTFLKTFEKLFEFLKYIYNSKGPVTCQGLGRILGHAMQLLETSFTISEFVQGLGSIILDFVKDSAKALHITYGVAHPQLVNGQLQNRSTILAHKSAK